MKSLKDTIRRSICATLLAALTTSYFVGCKQTNSTSTISDEDLYGPETTVSISETIESDITETSEDFLNLKGDYWFTEDSVSTEILELKDILSVVGKFADTDDLLIYSDGTSKCTLSSKMQIHLADNNKVSPSALSKHIRSINGLLHYFGLYVNTEAFYKNLAEAGLEEQSSLNLTKEISSVSEDDYEIYLNNMQTGQTVDIPTDYIPISRILTEFRFATLAVEDNAYTLTLNTAQGELIMTFVQNGSNIEYTLTDSTARSDELDNAGTYLVATGIKLEDSQILMTPEAVQRYLGYHVATYKCTNLSMLNIITDAYDVVEKDSDRIHSDTTDLVDYDLLGTDYTKPITDPENQSTIDTNQTDREIAEQILAEEQQAIEAITATPEEVEKSEQEKKDRQEMADNTQAYTTEGIPLTTEGGLTEPAKPTADYKLPEGAQLTFSGDPTTAERTTLPEGCYWTPQYDYPNAFTDPAGNIWLNTIPEDTTGARDYANGYYDPRGRYHYSQEEIDHAEALNAAAMEIAINGPTYDGTSQNSTVPEDKKADLIASLGW